MMTRIKELVAGMLSAIVAGGCAGMGTAISRDAALAPAWRAWVAGDFDAARSLGERLAAQPDTRDRGYHILALVAHMRGEYTTAIAHRSRIASGYKWLAHLDEPALWSHVHAGDLAGALQLAEQRRMPEVAAARLKLAVEHPFRVEMQGVAELAFTDDALSPYMPGIAATLCGQPAVARLDTGATFVHISADLAERLGITTVACESGFASLETGTLCFGAASEMTLAGATLRNVPVVVHHGALSTKAMADAFGVELGPIIGTNLLQRFLTTIDGPGRRLILSPRGDADARQRHLAILAAAPGEAHELPFSLWLDHYMIARGSLAGRPALWFVDSGLVTVEDGHQAALLAAEQTLAVWGVSITETPRLVKLPGDLCLGRACRSDLTAFPVPDATWKDFGDWGGVAVDALISWGFLSHFAWTIDFDRQTYTLKPAA